jgi:hypothetical protein
MGCDDTDWVHLARSFVLWRILLTVALEGRHQFVHHVANPLVFFLAPSISHFMMRNTAPSVFIGTFHYIIGDYCRRSVSDPSAILNGTGLTMAI